ncbi:M20/M25/M40 family metallo-hydrolase [Nocardiopsis lambiniae]|uniref:M20/M25/M40 family metallo-hydrolase n=1 Tax=Nocardiopsis lambiniae TaxID=3075539 RepID=A0ABU2MAW6_9ACTN|nr:M20/M25/M40 family metallo-hydrolase [Nocardiopsis sp. DSM 44743]MDT0329822.1 M20/M25/M40 family metallo-hydrolase [Nocardiopsis sp. DSM 44743]
MGTVTPIHDEARELLPEYVERLRALVGVDSGSLDPGGVDAVGDLVSGYLADAGAEVERVPVRHPDGGPLGHAVVGRLSGPEPGPTLLLAGHLDTVFERGTAARRPFTVENGRWARGPGVCDDKGGLLAGITAMKIAAPRLRAGDLVLYCGPDEEIGSLGSRPLLASLTDGADLALCLECAREDGSVVTGRKGVADVEVTFRGRAAHAGIEREAGANAALACARAAVRIERLNGRWPDAGINIGVMRSGHRPNVVPDTATLVLDVRADLPSTYTAVLDAIDRIASDVLVPGVEAKTAVVAPAPPWSPGAGDTLLRDHYLALAEQAGVDLAAVSTGGSADANLIAARGIPVLDGLGPVGGGDHGPDEWLDLDSVAPRTALLAELILWTADGGVLGSGTRGASAVQS